MEFGYLMSKFGRPRKAPDDAERHGVALVYEPTASGNFLLGSSREFRGFDTDPDPVVNAAIIRRALRFYPGMRDATMIRSYAGLRPWTPDHFPVVSSVPSLPGLFVAAGHEGDGIGLAAVTGELTAALVLGRPAPIDPAPLRIDRPGLRGHEVEEVVS
jgi:sarcosine oxidase subunit beta